MYNLFNTLRSPNPALSNLHCSFQPHNMDSSLTFPEEFFCFSEEQRKGKEKEKGLVYYTLPQMKLCSFNIYFCQHALPYHTWSLYKNSGQCCNSGIYGRPRNNVSSLQNLNDITVSTRRTCHFLTLSSFSFLTISWRMLKMPFLSLQISKFSGRKCPETPLQTLCLCHSFSSPPPWKYALPSHTVESRTPLLVSV